jgi:hypothetical protein
MIAAGKIYHSTSAQLSSYTTGWTQVGENVGMGPNPSILHTAFMGSPSHKANILGDYDRVGVGADRAPDGTMFVTVLFMKSASVPATTSTTTPPPTTAPPTTTTTLAPPVQTPVVASASAEPGVPTGPEEIRLLSPQPAPDGLEADGLEADGLGADGLGADGLGAAWLDLKVLAGSYCVVVRVDGAICVE